MKLDGYIRVSRVGGREGEGYIAPAVQREAIEGYARELNGEIVAWHDDQDQSGGSIDRPGFQTALDRLRAGETDGIVVMRIDRFARSVADGAAVVRDIIDKGQIFASCHERIDPRTPEGNYMLNSFLNNAELFLSQSKAQWWTAKSRAVARGAHIGPTPIGYSRIPRGQERGGCLEVDPRYGPAISRLFKRAASGEHRDSDLAKWMTETAPRKTGMTWQPSEIRRWLKNRIYLGEVHYGELVNPEAHEALTDPETWDSCQRESGDRRKSPSRFLLSGLIRCASCRYSMGGQWNAGADQNTPVYRCPCGASRGCKEPSLIVASRIEGFVIEAAKQHIADLELTAVVDDTTDLARIDEKLAQAEQEVHAFTSDLEARRLLGDDEWQVALKLRVDNRDTKRAARGEAYAKQQLSEISLSTADLSRQDLRGLLVGMVRHIFIRRNSRGAPASDRALIAWADDRGEIDVPGPHRSGPFESVRW